VSLEKRKLMPGKQTSNEKQIKSKKLQEQGSVLQPSWAHYDVSKGKSIIFNHL